MANKVVNVFETDRVQVMEKQKVYEGVSSESSSASLIKLYGKTVPHYHPDSTKILHVIYGTGSVFIASLEGVVSEVRVKSGSQVVIERGEIHCIVPDLYLEYVAFSYPASSEVDRVEIGLENAASLGFPYETQEQVAEEEETPIQEEALIATEVSSSETIIEKLSRELEELIATAKSSVSLEKAS